MKKLIALLLTLTVALSLASCGNKSETSDPTDNNESIGDFDFNTDVPSYDTEDETDTENDESSETGTTIGQIGLNVPDLSDIPSYEAPKDNIVDFELKAFTELHIDNIYEADKSKLEGMTEQQLEEIAKTKTNLLESLTNAFKTAGINVDIDEKSGEVSLDSSVLFGGDSAVLSADGKDFLEKFITTYSDVILDDEFDGFISKILVEGHTAPVEGSTYESGLSLSKERADNVKNYCLSSESGISADAVSALTKTFEAVGMSNSKPVKDSAGNVDVAASRRVAFRFLINLDK